MSSGNTMGGTACMCAEGSGSAGTPACLHMPQSSSECCWAGAWATLNGDGVGSSRSRGSSHGCSGSREGKGLCMDIAQPLSGGPACQSLCHLHKYHNLMGTVTAGTQAANFIGKLEQNKNVNKSIAIKHFKELLEFS